jgi:hypothetical protein
VILLLILMLLITRDAPDIAATADTADIDLALPII